MTRRPLMASWAAVLLLAVGLGGCISREIPVNMPTTEPPLVEKLSLSVGIHYPPGSRDYFFELYYGDGELYGDFGKKPFRRIELGPPSMQHFDRVFAAMFEKVKNVETRPGKGESLSGLDGLLVAAIVNFDMSRCLDVPSCSGTIVYRFSLFGREGKKIASWEARGTYSQKSRPHSTIESAIRQATAQFLVEFYQNQRVRDWLVRIRDRGERS